MKSEIDLSNGSAAKPLIAYYAAVCFVLASSLYPVGRVWGFAAWSHFPWIYVAVGCFGALVFPMAVIYWLARNLPDQDTEINSSRFYWLAAFTTTLQVCLFVLLRTRIHFLGDGYLQIGALSTPDPAIKITDYGGMLLPALLSRITGDYSREGALQTYQIVSIASGLLLGALVMVLARRIFGRRPAALAMACATLSGGYMLLYFGYVENYALFVAALTVCIMTGILVAQQKASRWWIVLSWGATIFYHVLGWVLLPAVLYILLRNTSFARRWSAAKMNLKIVTFIAGMIALSGGLVLTAILVPSLRISLVAPVAGQFTVEGYTLFSPKHLLDVANLIMLLVPGWMILAASWPRGVLHQIMIVPATKFLSLATLSSLAAVFLFDPKLGMPRDWDLFSFAGVPLLIGLVFVTLSTTSHPIVKFLATALFVGASWFSLTPRVISQAVPQIGLAQLHSYFDLDPSKNGPARQMLIGYYLDQGDTTSAIREQQELDRANPEVRLWHRGIELSDRGQFDEAIRVLRQAVILNPLNSTAWLNLANCYEQAGQLDSAISAIFTADLINPNSINIINTMGWICVDRGDYRAAEQDFKRALRIDPHALAPQFGLIRVYRGIGEREQQMRAVRSLCAREELPGTYFRNCGDDLLLTGDTVNAVTFYTAAIARGLDQHAADSLQARFPALAKSVIGR